MKIMIDLPDDIYTQLFDNGVTIPWYNLSEIFRAIRRGNTSDDLLNDLKNSFKYVIPRDG